MGEEEEDAASHSHAHVRAACDDERGLRKEGGLLAGEEVFFPRPRRVMRIPHVHPYTLFCG